MLWHRNARAERDPEVQPEATEIFAGDPTAGNVEFVSFHLFVASLQLRRFFAMDTTMVVSQGPSVVTISLPSTRKAGIELSGVSRERFLKSLRTEHVLRLPIVN